MTKPAVTFAEPENWLLFEKRCEFAPQMLGTGVEVHAMGKFDPRKELVHGGKYLPIPEYGICLVKRDPPPPDTVWICRNCGHRSGEDGFSIDVPGSAGHACPKCDNVNVGPLDQKEPVK